MIQHLTYRKILHGDTPSVDSLVTSIESDYKGTLAFLELPPERLDFVNIGQVMTLHIFGLTL